MVVAVAIAESSTCSIHHASYSSACYTHRDQKKRHNEPPPPEPEPEPQPPPPHQNAPPSKKNCSNPNPNRNLPPPPIPKTHFPSTSEPPNLQPPPFQTKRIPASLTSEPRTSPPSHPTILHRTRTQTSPPFANKIILVPQNIGTSPMTRSEPEPEPEPPPFPRGSAARAGCWAAPRTLAPCGFKGNLLNIGALMIRIRFWGILYYDYNKEPPKPYSNY